MNIPKKILDKMVSRATYPNGAEYYIKNTMWWTKGNCIRCIEEPIRYMSNEEYIEEYPPLYTVTIGPEKFSLCRHHLEELAKVVIEYFPDLAKETNTTPVLCGRWINPHWSNNSTSCANCSECGFEAQHSDFRGVQKYYKFCPNCGAKMDIDKVE